LEVTADAILFSPEQIIRCAAVTSWSSSRDARCCAETASGKQLRSFRLAQKTILKKTSTTLNMISLFATLQAIPAACKTVENQEAMLKFSACLLSNAKRKLY
jgi:hypothetical protein